MVLAGIIAAFAIVTNNPVLIVGAMIVSPDYGPMAALSVGERPLTGLLFGANLGAFVVASSPERAGIIAFGAGQVRRGGGVLVSITTIPT